MRKLIYYIGQSLDGYIAAPDGSFEAFPQTGGHADRFMSDMQLFDTVVMGRKTYESGYAYGLEPGQPAYPGMRNIVCSTGKTIPTNTGLTLWSQDIASQMQALKSEPGKNIYLCGGGELATFLAAHHLIDELHLKMVPILLGAGRPLFGGGIPQSTMQLSGHEIFENDVALLRYQFEK